MTQPHFVELGAELDRESYDWLVDNHPSIASAVETCVGRGATPEAVRRFVLERLALSATALRHAARAPHAISSKRHREERHGRGRDD